MSDTDIIRLASLCDKYDAFLIDLWGVMHDGSALYPGAGEAIAHLHARGKTVLFLSNAPRKSHRAVEVLTRLGVPRSHYAHAVTSGQVAHDLLKARPVWGKRYYYLGPGKDEDVLQGAGYTRVEDPVRADFILNTGFAYDYQPIEEAIPLLQSLHATGLPLLCVNPDLEVVKQDGTRLLCAGWVARHYEHLGGEVMYIGKPHPQVYAHCLELLGGVPRDRILAIGDNLLTDIRGANHQRIDSLLISGGILTSEHGTLPDEALLTSRIDESGATPVYVAEHFAIESKLRYVDAQESAA